MSTHAPLDQTTIAQILDQYVIGDVLSSRPFTAGAVQTNLFVATTTGNYVLRHYRQHRAYAAVLFEVNLVHYLNRHHYPCPAVVRDRRGRLAGCYQEKPYALFTFVEGEHLEAPTVEQQQQLVHQVAALHLLTQHYRPAQRHARWNYNPAFCATMAAETAQRLATSNAQAKLAWYQHALAQVSLPAAHPKGVCHCDFHFSNVLFKGGKFHALLDFDDANYTYLTFDLVALLEPALFTFRWDSWETVAPADQPFDFAAARLILAAYQAVRPLSPIEKRHLFDVLKLATLIDCLWYFERGAVENFYERRKIECVDAVGRTAFYDHLFRK